jgi:hypothetical protein
MSRSVGEPLSDGAFKSAIGTLFVIDTEGDALVISKIEFLQIPMQMLRAHVMVHADDAALEDAEEAFDRVGVPEVGAYVLLGRVIDGAMAGKLLADLAIGWRLIGHEIAGLVDLSDHRVAESGASDIGDMARANLATALDKRQDDFLRRNVVFRFFALPPT